MITARLSTQDSPEVWWEQDPTVRVRADFPLSAARGSQHSAVVYFELEPGCRLGRHTDSAEEVLLILQGTVEVTVGEETGRASAGQGSPGPTAAGRREPRLVDGLEALARLFHPELFE